MSEDRLAAMQGQLDRIERALTGDPALGQEGLVSRSKDHERRIKLLERIAMIGAGAGMILSGLYTVARDFFIPKHTG